MSLFKKKQKHVTIVPNQDFLEGSQRYVKGNKYRVDVNMARYFEQNGWIEGASAEVSGSATLDIDSTTHGHRGGF